jgi:hypothetical protein
VIAQAAHRHRDLCCVLIGHRLVRYPRAVGVDTEGALTITDDTYCRHCERLISRRPVASGSLARKVHLLSARGIFGGNG